ncbi:MAG TPA: cation:proton antiporter, partial [Kiloniellales bacterium]|nr:cation:proton antiporter [Kiloniellales bacterium]
PLIVTLVAGLGFAFILGFLATKLRLPPIVGYLLAGIMVGPHTPGVVADPAMAAELAEIGVILLMFGVGLHFSTDDLMAVRWIAVPGAVGQIVIATAIGAGVAILWGWELGAGIVLGLALSVASTVVLLRALDQRNAVATPNGRIAIGWLIVEDLAMVLTLVLLPALAGLMGGVVPSAAEGNLFAALGITLLKVAAFVAVVLLLGPRLVPYILGQVARTGSRELFTLAVLGVALGIAFGAAELFGVSFALGAFCAGVVLSKSAISHRAGAEALPLQNAFAVLFFVSVGMLFDPTIVVREPWALVAVLFVILFGKSIVAFVIVLVLGYPVGTALTVSASLAQIGEFSFILAGLGIALELLPPEGRDLILAAALLSITLNPAIFALVAPLEKRLAPLLPGLEQRGQRRLERVQQQMSRARRRVPQATLEPRELQRFALLADLSPEERDELLPLFRPRSAQPGERIFRTGDRAEALYFIVEGRVEVVLPEGNSVELGPGDVFGEMALLSGRRRSADVVALDYSQFLMLTVEDFDAFVATRPHLMERLDRIARERADSNPRHETAAAPPGSTSPATPA